MLLCLCRPCNFVVVDSWTFEYYKIVTLEMRFSLYLKMCLFFLIIEAYSHLFNDLTIFFIDCFLCCVWLLKSLFPSLWSPNVDIYFLEFHLIDVSFLLFFQSFYNISSDNFCLFFSVCVGRQGLGAGYSSIFMMSNSKELF